MMVCSRSTKSSCVPSDYQQATKQSFFAACSSMQVEFPESISPEQVAGLRLALPGGMGDENGVMESDEHEECHMKPVEDMNEEFKSRAKIARAHINSGNAYDSDDEDDMGGRGQRVQCAQQ